jgi:hypothetical protein
MKSNAAYFCHGATYYVGLFPCSVSRLEALCK